MEQVIYYKVGQSFLQSGTVLLQSGARAFSKYDNWFIAKRVNYDYKVEQVLQSQVTLLWTEAGITKYGIY